jgi:hypothetical protein
MRLCDMLFARTSASPRANCATARKSSSGSSKKERSSSSAPNTRSTRGSLTSSTMCPNPVKRLRRFSSRVRQDDSPNAAGDRCLFVRRRREAAIGDRQIRWSSEHRDVVIEGRHPQCPIRRPPVVHGVRGDDLMLGLLDRHELAVSKPSTDCSVTCLIEVDGMGRHKQLADMVRASGLDGYKRAGVCRPPWSSAPNPRWNGLRADRAVQSGKGGSPTTRYQIGGWIGNYPVGKPRRSFASRRRVNHQ